MKRSSPFLVTSALLLAAPVTAAAAAASPTNHNAYFAAPPAVSARTSAAETASLPPAVVASTDEKRGVPTFMWPGRGEARAPLALRDTPEAAARWYLTRHAARYHLSEEALQTVETRVVHDTGRGGIIVVFGQQVDGIEVQRDTLKVLMTRDLNLVAISGNLHPSAVPGASSGRRMAFHLSESQAIANALRDMYGVKLPASSLVDNGRSRADYRYFDLAPIQPTSARGLRFAQPARVKSVFYPMPDRLVPAYYLELLVSRGGTNADGYAYVIAADDGRLLFRQNQVAEAAFTYRLWAETTGIKRPLGGPRADYFPHPTGEPDGSLPPFVTSSLVSADGFNKGPTGAGDPWLAAGATVTTGNNVDAYADIKAPDGYNRGDTRPTTTTAGIFDRTYDTSLDAGVSSAQNSAAVVSLFYVNNWLHDYWYDSGFNEAAGAAQTSNYNRGGIEGDPLLAEGEDNSGTSNANMYTPADGQSPRMQMYIFSGPITDYIELSSTGSTQHEVGTAAFGPTEFDLTGPVTTINDGSTGDGTGSVTDGCEAYKVNLNGKIALIDRGSCTFQIKAANAEANGAVGVIIANNKPDEPPPGMAADSTAKTVTIPTLSITMEDATALKTALAGGAVTAHMYLEMGTMPDGTIDNAIVAHEWGHYLHHRLVDCSVQVCRGQSEGWADFTALQMQLHENDDLDGTFAMAVYASIAFGDTGYYGIRRVPYSVDFSRDPWTFAMIQADYPLPEDVPMNFTGDNEETHNVGEVWASMLWESYVAMLRDTQESSPRYTFSQAQRVMSDYHVSGMMMAPVEPTFTEQRDALLAAAAANDGTDFQEFAEAFARRGAGTCAVSPPRDSTDLVGVVESYELAPEQSFVSIELDDSVSSCDKDGYLDAAEIGHVSLKLLNTGATALAGSVATVSSTTPGVTFANGGVVSFGTVAPFAIATATVDISLDGSMVGIGQVDLTATIDNPTSCTQSVTLSRSFMVNLDDVPSSSTTDTAESKTVAWTETIGQGPKAVWSRYAMTDTSHVYHGVEEGSISDARWESPAMKVAATGDFVVSFRHRHQFETSPETEGGPDVYWDGGVLEISIDSGAHWVDISKYVDPGYGGPIGQTDSNNPLYGKQGYVDQNKSWPEMDAVKLNLTNKVAGKTVKIRFRIGTDEAQGDYGWDVDDFSVQGITNLPFPSIIEDKAQAFTFYADADGDNFGDPALPVQICQAVAGYVPDQSDCDDSDDSAYPGALEQCDGIDNDCNATVDDNPQDGQTYYADSDEDGYGDPDSSAVACEQPEGFITAGSDCDDTDALAFPGSPEICDGADNDCNGSTDDNPTDGSTFYPDADKDGHGASSASIEACTAPKGYVASSDDCNDNAPSVYPGAAEPADGVDHDCDGDVTHSGDDDATSGDDDATSGDDDATSGDDDATHTGDDDATHTGDDDASPAGDDDASSGSDDGSTGCSCSDVEPTSGSRSMLPSGALLLAGALLLRRRR